MAQPPRPVLALDIGGTKLAVGVVTSDGTTHSFLVEPTRRDEGHEIIIARLFELGRRAIEAASLSDPGLADIAAVGISCGGPLDAASGILLAPLHLPGWIDVPIADMASAAFGVPAILENDASAAALGEYHFGEAKGASTALYLTVSTGIGGGAVLDGSLHKGAAGNGGEYGHIMVRPGGRPCLCGRLGCLEGYASGTSIAQRAREAIAQTTRESALRALDVILAEDVAAAAQAGDAVASEVWDETTSVLAQAITDLVNVFEPDVVVLGGGVTRSGEQLLRPIREAVLRDAMPPAAGAVRLALAGLGDTVGVVGAAVLAFDLLESELAESRLNA
jgi:glucokinase